MDRAMQMISRFWVHRNHVCTCACKIFDVLIRVLNHQVCINGQLGCLAHPFDNERANRQIRDKVAVHHIEVNVRRAPAFHRRDLLAQPREVRR